MLFVFIIKHINMMKVVSSSRCLAILRFQPHIKSKHKDYLIN